MAAKTKRGETEMGKTFGGKKSQPGQKKNSPPAFESLTNEKITRQKI